MYLWQGCVRNNLRVLPDKPTVVGTLLVATLLRCHSPHPKKKILCAYVLSKFSFTESDSVRFPQYCQFACSCAISKLEDILCQLHTGDISVVQLKEIKEAQDGMKILCDAATEKKTSGKPDSTEWKLTLTERCQEYDEFQKQNDFLFHLCQKIPRVVSGTLE